MEELCGYAYMPATLDLFARELKCVGVSSTLWEVHARHWLEQTADWGPEREAAVLYIDATHEPVWMDLFSQSSKVSSTGRVMPALETVAFDSGYGVPWLATSSGRTPLVKATPGLLDELCEINEGAEIGRIVVIDAEGNSVPFLKGLGNSGSAPDRPGIHGRAANPTVPSGAGQRWSEDGSRAVLTIRSAVLSNRNAKFWRHLSHRSGKGNPCPTDVRDLSATLGGRMASTGQNGVT